MLLSSIALMVALLGQPTLLGAKPAAVTEDRVLIDAEEIDAQAAYTLIIDDVNGELDAEVVVDLTLHKQSQRVGEQIIDYALTSWNAILPANASNIAVFDDRGPLVVETIEDDVTAVRVVNVKFGRKIFSGRTHRITLSYSLPENHPPTNAQDIDRSDLSVPNPVIINDAAVAWLFSTDPGYDRWTAELTVPPEFELNLDEQSEPLWHPTSNTSDVWLASGSDLTVDYVVLENDDEMDETTVQHEDQTITVRYWPGDLNWRDRVTSQITADLPALVALVGRPWPKRDLVVQQSARTLGTTYGGWYADQDGTITIGPTVDDTLILHELSHVWFNYRNLKDRWLIEGLAEEFANLVVYGPNGGEPLETSLSSPSARPLKNWAIDDLGSDDWTDDAGAIEWAYHGSWHVVRRTREDIGEAAFTSVTSSLINGIRSYPDQSMVEANTLVLDTADETTPASSSGARLDWREFLDLAVEQGSDKELSELFMTWVEGGPSQEFVDRSISRDRYQTLVDRATGWTMPEAVRVPMRHWRFDEANRAMEATAEYLDSIESHQTRLAQHNLSLPPSVQLRFSLASTVDDVDAEREELVTAVDDIVELETQLDSLGLIERIGLFGGDLAAMDTEARRQFSLGEFDAAGRSGRDALRVIGKAESDGYARLAGGGSVVMLLTAIAGLQVSRRRSRRPAAPDMVIDLTAADPRSVVDGDHGELSDEMTTSQRSRQSRHR